MRGPRRQVTAVDDTQESHTHAQQRIAWKGYSIRMSPRHLRRKESTTQPVLAASG